MNSSSPRTLAALSRLACEKAGIAPPPLVAEKETDHAATLPIDIESDILGSDKTLNLDLLDELAASPTKAQQAPSQHQQPLAGLCQTEDYSKSPVVVPVTMYWNTFPALLIEGVKYVRLIDISRQALPSKETGLWCGPCS